MIRLDAATVLLQWSVGGLAFLWVTTRRREVGIGYGWLMRAVFAALALGAFGAGRTWQPSTVRDVASLLVALAASGALAVSVVRRRAGVAQERVRLARKAERVESMVGSRPPEDSEKRPLDGVPEFPPVLDLVAPALGVIGLIAAALATGGPVGLALARTLVGAAFLGVVTDAMLLGHWYLVQPGLGRGPLLELVRATGVVWPVEVATLVWPTGMFSVLSGTIDDGWNGTLGWFWLACAVATGVLAFVTAAALKERAYSAVMAATGLLYLAILTAFGTDLVARAVLAT